jgi:hypothetical protein
LVGSDAQRTQELLAQHFARSGEGEFFAHRLSGSLRFQLPAPLGRSRQSRVDIDH